MDLRRGAASLEGTSPTLIELVGLCNQLDVSVHLSRLPEGCLGVYDHPGRRVLLARGLTPVEQRSVLAHELGHALLMHVGSSSADERAAERFAARVLIDPLELEEACRWAHDDVELSDELGVTVDIVRSFRDQLGVRRPPRVA